MKNYLIFVILLLFLGCSDKKSDLEIIKNYHPEKKYFIANLTSLHYMIETDKPEELKPVFENVINKMDIPVDAAGCKDGIYTGTSPADAFDFVHRVEIEIKDEKIIRVSYDEINDNGVSKKKSKVYGQQMESEGTTPAIAYNYMEEKLLEQQNYMEVDAVTGATYSLYRFRFAMAIALIKAKMGKSQ